MSPKTIFLLIVSAIVGIVGLSLADRIVEHMDAGEIAVFQYLDGSLHCETTPGWKPQYFGKVTKYHRSYQFAFGEKVGDDSYGGPEPIKIRFADGAHGYLHGSIRVDMPLSTEKLLDIHQTYGTEQSVVSELIQPLMNRSTYLTGPLMTSKESYSDRRNEIPTLIEDQARNGTYQTYPETVDTIDAISKEKRSITVVRIKTDAMGNKLRQEDSPATRFGIKLYNLSLSSLPYDKEVESQIADQQRAVMQVQTAMAKSKEAEQDKLTAAMRGEADAIKAKWEQEQINAKAVAQADGARRIAEQNKLAAEFTKQEQILLGEGEAARKRLVMEANGALDVKLEAWKEVNFRYADAIQKMSQPLVPHITMGNTGASNSNVQSIMDMISIKTAQDLSLDMKMQKK